MEEEIIQLISIIEVHEQELSKYQGIIDSSSDMQIRLLYYPKVSVTKKKIKILRGELRILKAKIKINTKQKRKKFKTK